MKRAYVTCLFHVLMVTFLLSQFLLSQSNPAAVVNPSAASDPKAQARILDSYGKLPLTFEANHGQTDSRVKFLSRAGGYTLFLTGDEAVIALRGKAKAAAPKGASGFKTIPVSLKRYPDTNPSVKPASEKMTGGVLRMKLRGANPAAEVTGVDELAGTSNYFIGNDPAKWRTGVPTYAKVKYAGIYSGIDLVYYGNQRQLEYDFIVAPGADPRRIAFDVRGAKRILRDARGDLVLKIGQGEIRWHRPVVYQEKDGARQLVAARYVVADGNRVGFELAKYDTSRALYIDPLVYSTYLGGSGGDQGNSIAVDSAGNAYVAGITGSSDFPTMNPLQPAYGGNVDAFVTKINTEGSALVYSTYLGGGGYDQGAGVAIDGAGNAYITGTTNSTNFPVTPGAFQTTCGNPSSCESAFVTKINTSGSTLVYSTYLGGNLRDSGSGIAVDSLGDAYVTGGTNSTNFPVTPGAFQTVCGGGCLYSNAFVTKLNPSGTALEYSTYLGGDVSGAGHGIAVDSAGNAYVTGSTNSSNFPITTGAFQTVCGGCDDGRDSAVVTKFNPAGSALVYSSYLGGFEDYGVSIAVDSAGNAYVTGTTYEDGFPTTPGAFQQSPHIHSFYNAFVTKFNYAGSELVYSTYLGGSVPRNGDKGGADGASIAVDSMGNAYVTGSTYSFDFPVTHGAYQTKCGNRSSCLNAFVTEFNPTGSALVDSTYLGGSGYDQGDGVAVDGVGNVYITGSTSSTDFPVTAGAFQTTCGNPSSCGNAFVTKILMAVTTTTLTSSPNPSTYGQPVTFTAVVTAGSVAPPDGETVSFMKSKTVLGTGTLSGGSASFTTSTLKVGTMSVKAIYGGNSNFAGSTSKAVKQVVEKASE
jgi:hypothetical protein